MRFPLRLDGSWTDAPRLEATGTVAVTPRLTLGYEGRFGLAADGEAGLRREEPIMLAALNMGIIGTIIVIAIVVAVVLFLMRRA